ncbi:hypothetical protein Sste5346_009093 [Sporothrix stenoceras]|uniref:Uncharacterized protein n=1 Tax=Sporothrix stenoceras TaxID=5173 RepID=A0ABR3YM68_9PEZI
MSPSEKPGMAHLEATVGDTKDANAAVKGGGDTFIGEELVKSRFDEMSPARTLWVFRRVALVSLAVYTGYVCEGFEVGQGSLNVGQVVTLVYISWFAEKFGRKSCLYLAWLWLVILKAQCPLDNRSRRSMHLVDTRHPYNALFRHYPDVLRVIVSTEAAGVTKDSAQLSMCTLRQI